MSIVEEIKRSFSGNSAVRNIIVLNVAVFLATSLVALVLYLAGTGISEYDWLLKKLMLPASFKTFIVQPWSLFTYMFLHSGFMHILFNMLWLWWIGGLMLEYLGSRKVLEAYLLGGLAGGLFYMICYNVFPVFRDAVPGSYALGASAGVLAVVVATATLLPDYPFQLLFFGTVRLKWIAVASVVLDLISIPAGNAGGHLSHIGGAIFGFLYTKYLYQQTIFPQWLTNPSTLFRKKARMKVHYRTTYLRDSDKPSEEEIDAILDKISRSGYDSLTRKEKEQLFKASKE
jgi:membrane associated rhomboid family serine protease